MTPRQLRSFLLSHGCVIARDDPGGRLNAGQIDYRTASAMLGYSTHMLKAIMAGKRNISPRIEATVAALSKTRAKP